MLHMNRETSDFLKLKPRDIFAGHRIQREIGESDLGVYYEVTVGSTMHAFRLLILYDLPGVDLAVLGEVVGPLLPVIHPCLCKPFAFGEDDGRLWIRSALSQDMLFGDFSLPKAARGHALPVGELVSDAGRLRDLMHGLVPQGALWSPAADLLEGLAYLHASDQTLGPLSLESVVFQKPRRGSGVVAQWADYGMLPLLEGGAGRTTKREDVRNVGSLLLNLLGGDNGLIPSDAWPEWKPFLDCAMGDIDGAFADGAEMFRAFTEMLGVHGLQREPRKAAAPSSNVANLSAEKEKRQRLHERRQRIGASRSRSRRHDSPAKGITILQEPAFRFLAIIGILCAIGFLSYWLLSRDVRLRREGLIGPSAEFLTEESFTAPAAGAPVTVWNLSREGLEELAAEGNLFASMRLAFMVAKGDTDNAPDAEAGRRMAEGVFAQLEEMVARGEHSADLHYWLGYALLTGFGAKPEIERGLDLLEEAAGEHNMPQAMELLGDYYAAGLDGWTAAKDVIALQWWRGAIDAVGDSWDVSTLTLANKAMAFINAGRGLPRGDPASFMSWVERQAMRNHLPSIVAIGRILLEGRITSVRENDAMQWLRIAALGGDAEGMFRIAGMYERGLGTPQSDRTAFVWYKRAALAGNPEAMERLADLVENGDADVESADFGAAEWREKAADAREVRKGKRDLYAWWQPGADGEEDEFIPLVTAIEGVRTILERGEKKGLAEEGASDSGAPSDVGSAAASNAVEGATAPEAESASLSAEDLPPVPGELILPGDGAPLPFD